MSAGLVLVAVTMLLLTLGAAAPSAAKKPFQNGEVVKFTGNVVDANGEPVADVEVRLEASRQGFSVTRFRSLLYHTQVVETRTDEFGSYRIDWTWHNYYNHFRIAAVLSVPAPGGVLEVKELASADLSSRWRDGSPIVTPLLLESTELLTSLRAFEATVETSDERRVYREQGKPDRVEEIEQAGDSERAWWYFELGTVYRFSGGALREVETFDPIPALDAD